MSRKRSNVISLLLEPKVLFIIYIIIGLGTALQSLLLGPKLFDGVEYTHYNNFLIFRQSFFHLLRGFDLYVLYPQEHWDLYKYSPTFALLFAPIAILPSWLGLIFWNLLNTMVLYFAIRSLAFTEKKKIIFIQWFLVIELISTTQNNQSNALMAGLMIFSFSLLEKDRPFWAALMMALSFYIKIFGIIALIFWFFYPRKIRLSLFTFFWMVLLGSLPLIVVSPATYIKILQSWFNLLQADQAASYGVSVMGILVSWFSINVNQLIITFLGLVILLFPLIRRVHYTNFDFRILVLASVLIWVILFNHRAESQTFIIAVAGVGIWYFSKNASLTDTILLILTYILTCLSPVDFFPRYIREHYVIPYALKAFPVLLIWLKLSWDVLSQKSEVKSQKSKVKSQKSEVKSQKSKVKSQKLMSN